MGLSCLLVLWSSGLQVFRSSGLLVLVYSTGLLVFMSFDYLVQLPFGQQFFRSFLLLSYDLHVFYSFGLEVLVLVFRSSGPGLLVFRSSSFQAYMSCQCNSAAVRPSPHLHTSS